MGFPASRARRVLDSLDEQVAVIDRAGSIVYVNAAWVEFGRANGAPASVKWVGTNYLTVCRTAQAAGDCTAADAVRGFEEVIAGRAPRFLYEYPCFSPDEERWFMMRVAEVRDSDAQLFVVSHQDITQRKQAEQRVEALSLVDALTGLANRRRLDTVLQNEWQRSMRTRQPISLLMLDIDHFKDYNDGHGHLAGDRCLAEVAHTLARHAQRPGDLAARFGGEEFAVVLGGTSRNEAAALAIALAADIRSLALRHPNERPVTVSIGIATAVPARGQSVDDLVARADAALYCAKHEGRDRIVQEGRERIPAGS
jgi:diguanylate cyclase (GGDEF)-like protein